MSIESSRFSIALCPSDIGLMEKGRHTMRELHFPCNLAAESLETERSKHRQTQKAPERREQVEFLRCLVFLSSRLLQSL
ncbi:hypothetical protein ACQP3F_29925, partial [Escherichia coli]